MLLYVYLYNVYNKIIAFRYTVELTRIAWVMDPFCVSHRTNIFQSIISTNPFATLLGMNVDVGMRVNTTQTTDNIRNILNFYTLTMICC